MKPGAKDWLEKLHGLALDRPVRIMNVCGGHERSISMAGLRTAIANQSLLAFREDFYQRRGQMPPSMP